MKINNFFDFQLSFLSLQKTKYISDKKQLPKTIILKIEIFVVNNDNIIRILDIKTKKIMCITLNFSMLEVMRRRINNKPPKDSQTPCSSISSEL